MLSSLQIIHLRNIASALIKCAPRFNLFFGDNAAGKTSILEAIYYLGTGKSFRTSHHERVISHSENQLTLFSRLQLDESIIQIGLQRSISGLFQIRINEENIKSVSEISHHLPIQFIGSDSHRILSDGPKARRHFLDWGLFHTNPAFHAHWKAFQKILIQRNAALKAQVSREALLIWNQQFSQAGDVLNAFRNAYVIDFAVVFNEIIHILLPGVEISIEYYPGWDDKFTLEACLIQNVSRETYVGYSLYGPHRADLWLSVNNFPAEDVLSQGQQKLVSYALRLAQGMHLQSSTAKTPVYLIDDLPSELDPQKRALVIEMLSHVRAQVFITGVEKCDLEEICALNADSRMFHVKHGAVVEQKQECFT